MARSNSYRSLVLSLGLLGLSSVGVAASVTCDTIKNKTSIEVDFDGFAIPPAPYAKELSEYWSTSCSDLKPACVVAPATAQEVSTVLQVLQTNNESFAVKSGGFSTNPDWASVAGGPLITTRNLNEVTYDAAKGVVRVGPGNSWNDVQKVLDPLGVTVAGGRVGAIGVGGYMVGGGFSFLSTQHGWGVNTLAAVELVLPNGTVTTASATQNPELFAALKGGGNNFGIVTTFVMEAIPIGQVWGGMMVFPGGSDRADAMLSAISNFTARSADHPEAGIIATVQLVLDSLLELWIVFFFYDGPTPKAGVFDEFLALPPLLNLCKTRPYADLLSGNSAIVLHGSRYKVATEMAPLPPPAASKSVLRSYYDHWANVTRSYGSVFGLTTSMAIQPVPKDMAAIARQKGGDLLDLDDDVDRLIFEYDLSYLFAGDDDAVGRATLDLTTGMKALVDGYAEQGVTAKTFLPLFANDAFKEQDYYARLRPEKRALAHNVSLAVDNQGLFRTRTGGWKP